MKKNFSIVNRNENQDSLKYTNSDELKTLGRSGHSILNNLDELNRDFRQELNLYKKELKIHPFTPQDSEKFYRRICHLKEFASIAQEYFEKFDRLIQNSNNEKINNSVIEKAEKLKRFLKKYQNRAEFTTKKIEYDLFMDSVLFFEKHGHGHYKRELMKIQAKIKEIPEDDTEEIVDEDDDNDENEETNDLKLEVLNQKEALLIKIGQHFNWDCIVKEEEDLDDNLKLEVLNQKKALLTKKDFPDELWISIAGFLNKSDLDSLSFLNRNFALIAWQTMVYICKDKFGCFPFSPVIAYGIKLLKNLNSTRKYFNNRYYTLFDPVYAELFEAIEKKDAQKAQHFILTQLKANKSNLIDRVFYQKNSKGQTAISLAGHYKLQKFLDFCFNTFIVEGHRLNLNADILVKTGNYSEVMDDLNHSMSNEALWIFACAFICKQDEPYRIISQKSAWQRAWMDQKEPQSLAGMAILLSSYDLLKLALEVVNGPAWVNHQEHIHNQVLRKKSFHAANLYVTRPCLSFSPIEMAAFGKNQVIIDYIFGLMEQDARLGSDSDCHNLLCYFVECKDLKGLGLAYSSAPQRQDSDLFNRYLNIDSDHQLSPLGVAIAKNWMQGFKYLLMQGELFPLVDESFLKRHLRLALEFERIEMVKHLLSSDKNPITFDYSDNKNPAPIFYAIRKNNLQLVKLLVENKASLMSVSYDNKFTSPLIEAALNENEAIIQYIVQKLGNQKASELLFKGLSIYAEHKRENFLIKAAFNQVLSSLKGPSLTWKEEKKHSVEKFPGKRVPWFKLSLSVWVGILTGGFLEEKDLLHLLQTHSVFAFNVLQRVLDIYFFKPLSVSHLIDFSKSLYHQYASLHPRYYTLFDYDYIRLFRFVEERNLLGAQRFIESKNNDPALIDKIFYQKDGFGKSVVTLARRLRFQSFLTFCYKTVLLNNMEFITRRSVVYFDLPQALSFVFSPHEPMSESVLWIYACAYACNQRKVCQIIRQQQNWNKNWISPNMDLSLAMVAAILGCADLLEFVLNQLNKIQIEFQTTLISRGEMPLEFYNNRNHFRINTNGMVAISKNPGLIKTLNFYNGASSEMLFYYIGNKDIKGLTEFCHKWSHLESYYYRSALLYNAGYHIYSEKIACGTPLIAAILKNWLEGVQCIVENTCFSLKTERHPLNGGICCNSLHFALKQGHADIVEYLLSKGANPDGFMDLESTQPAPIFIAIKNNRLDLVILLHEYKASLEIEDKSSPVNERPCPLISAIINSRPEITQFLIKNTNNAARKIEFAIKKYRALNYQDTGILSSLEKAYQNITHNTWPNLFQPNSGSISYSSDTTQFGLI